MGYPTPTWPFALKAIDFYRFARMANVIVDEGTIRIEEDGWSMSATDPAHVSHIQVRLPRTSFFRYERPARREVGIDIEALRHVLVKIVPGSEVSVGFDTQGSDNLMLLSFGRATRKMTTLATQDVSPPPRMTLPNSIKIYPPDMVAALKQCEPLDTSVSLKVVAEGLEVSAGEDGNEYKDTLPATDDWEVKDPEARSMHPIDYLMSMFSCLAEIQGGVLMRRDAAVLVRLGRDYPVRLEWPNGVYLLAPRIESE